MREVTKLIKTSPAIVIEATTKTITKGLLPVTGRIAAPPRIAGAVAPSTDGVVAPRTAGVDAPSTEPEEWLLATLPLDVIDI